MQQAIDTFKLNISSVRQIDVIYQFLMQNEVKTLDLSELLRTEIVLSVSALDNFISDIIHICLIQTFKGNIQIPADFAKPFKEFQIDMQTLVQISAAATSDEKLFCLGNFIRKYNSKNPYQDPKQIESAMLLLGIRNLWTKVGTELAMKGDDVKRELANIVWQRHKIAHEADFDYLTQSKRIRDRQSTLFAIEFLEKLCVSIYTIVKLETKQ
ncbi:MAG: hypothetical protein JXR65_12790 [Bacteroidales bacterium]|nr:hypothetical protein [Gammaproteobacteria bacterium]MBN2639952.1 hypothetical protein [Bacteroidales bacterium]